MRAMILNLVSLCLLGQLAFGQGADAAKEMGIGTIQLSVVVENNADQLNASQLSKLETKTMSIASRHGVGGQGYNSPFLLTPTLALYDDTPVETGMRTVRVVTIDLTLQIKQNANQAVFATYSRTLKGSGFSRDEAINNAISQINPNDPKAKLFIEEGKGKIIAFYNSKCSQISSEADRYMSMNNFEHALAILTMVPVEASPCYENIKDKSIEVFKKHQDKLCQSQLQTARAQIAANFFVDGLSTLSLIDPTSKCFQEAKSLIASTETKLDDHISLAWKRQREVMRDAVELEKMRIKAIRDMTVAYYNRKPEVRNNIYLFIQ